MTKVVKVSIIFILSAFLVLFVLLNLEAVALYLPLRGPVNVSLIILLGITFIIGGISAFVIIKIIQVQNKRREAQLREQVTNEINHRRNNLRMKLKAQNAKVRG